METFSALLALCEENPPVDSPHKGSVTRVLIFLCYPKQNEMAYLVGIMTSSNGNVFRVIGTLWGKSTCGFPSQRVSNASFDFLCYPKQTTNSRVAGDLRRHGTHCDVSVMKSHKVLIFFCMNIAAIAKDVKRVKFLFNVPGINIINFKMKRWLYISS